MKQRPFEQNYQPEWQAFSQMLDWLEQPLRKAAAPLPLAEFPAAYRRLCQHLAIARARRYSGPLLERLNQMALRAHQHLYRAPRRRWQAALEFLLADFPRRVRAEAQLFWFCTALFYLPLLGIGLATHHAPELIYHLMEPEMVAQLEQNYAPDSEPAQDRAATEDLAMFGFYISNNIGIGFRTFASGLLLGAGSVFMLLFNGVFIGAVSGYLTARGYIENFYTFVAGHGAFELTGIVLAGVAGMKLGWALVAPGRLSRAEALRQAAAEGAHLMVGVIALLLLAAFIEAFWSSNRAIPSTIKYLVGVIGWVLVIGYLTWAGRRAA